MFLASCGASLFLQAQDTSTYIADYNILSYREGMGGRHPKACIVSREGYLWVLTEEQLNCYDGNRFRTYDLPETNGEAYSSRLLLEDYAGNIWYGAGRHNNLSGASGYQESWINILDTCTDQGQAFDDFFEDRAPFSANQISFARADEKSQLLYLGTKRGKVYTFGPKGFRLLFQSMEPEPVGALAVGKEGKYWIGQSDELRLVDTSGQILLRRKLFFSPSAIKRLNQGWLDLEFPFKTHFGGKLVNRLLWNIDEQKLQAQLSLSSSRIDIGGAYSLAYQKKHGLWHVIKRGDWKIYNRKGKLVFSLLEQFPEFKRNFFPDKNFRLSSGENGVLYATFFSRLICLSVEPSLFQRLLTGKQLSLRDIVEGKGDTLLISTYDGLYAYDRGEQRGFPLPEKRFWIGALPHSSGQIWGVHSGAAVRVYDKEGNITKIIPLLPQNKEEYYGALSLFEDSKGQVWLGTSRGLAKYDPAEEVFKPCRELNRQLGINKVKVRHIEQRDSLIWCATERGLQSFTLDGRAGEASLSGSDMAFNHFYWQDPEHCWLASLGRGLLLWNPTSGAQQWYTAREHGLSDDHIYGIYPDKNGRFWLPTNQGLTCFDPATQQVRTFDQNAGLHGEEFNYNSHYKSPDGALWLGGVNGMVHFHPDSFDIQQAVNTPLNLVYIGFLNPRTGLMEEQPAMRQNKRVELNAARRINAFQLQVALASYLDPQQHQYFWFAEGLTDSWQMLEGNSLTLADLPYGEFLLRIRARTQNRVWSSQELQLHLIVLKPFYLKWWFWLLVAAALALLISSIIQWRVRQLKRAKTRLTREVEERTQQIKADKQTILEQKQKLEQLNLGKDKVMSIVGHELRGNLFFISSTADQISQMLEQKDYRSAHQLIAYLQRASLQVNEILDNLSRWVAVRTGKVVLHKQPFAVRELLEQVVEDCQLFAERKGIELTAVAEPPTAEICGDLNALQAALQNLTRNAIKFTDQGGRVSLSARAAEGKVHLKVSDTGVGMESEQAAALLDGALLESRTGTAGEVGTGLGINIVKELLQQHQASIEVESQPDQGTTFTIVLPGTPKGSRNNNLPI